MALFDVLSFGLFLAIVRRRRPQSAGWAALTYVVTSTILCHVLYDHLDEGTLLFSMLGAYAWTQTLGAGRGDCPNFRVSENGTVPFAGLRARSVWSTAAFFFFGLGFSYKVIPVIAVPFLLLAQWRDANRAGKGDRHLLPERPSGCFAQKEPVPFSRWKRLAAALTGFTLGMAGPFAIQYAVSGPGIFALFAHHAGREIQVESLYSTLMWLGSLFGRPISISLADGAYCVFGDWSGAMKMLSTGLLCGFLGTAGVWAIFRGARFRGAAAFALACYVLGASAIFSKVLSPQYFVWSIPLLLLAAVEVLPEKGKSAWILAGLLIVAAGLTTWLFPYHYFCVPPGLKAAPMLTSHGLIPCAGRFVGTVIFGLCGACVAEPSLFGNRDLAGGGGVPREE